MSNPDKTMNLYELEADIIEMQQRLTELMTKKTKLEKELNIDSASTCEQTPSTSSVQLIQQVERLLNSFQTQCDQRVKALEDKIDKMDTKISEKIHTMESSIQNVNDKLTETSDTIVRMQEEMYVFEEEESAEEALEAANKFERDQEIMEEAEKMRMAMEEIEKLQQEDRQPPLPKYSIEEIAQHNKENNAWIALFDQVYDLTNFFNEHPGGAEILLANCGLDASDAFLKTGHSIEAFNLMKKMKIGKLKREIASTTEQSISQNAEKPQTPPNFTRILKWFW